MLGAFVGLVAFGVWRISSHSGFGASFGGSLFIAGGVTLIVLGIGKAMDKKLPGWAYGAAGGVALLLFTLLGPSVSASAMESKEKKLFAECSNGTNAYCWTTQYEKDIPERFRNKEWRLEWMKTRVKAAKDGRRVGDLRAIANECDAADDSELLEPAKAEAIKALKTFYDAGKEKMFANRSGGTEFPVDNALREGFAVVIDELSKSKDPNVYVLFKNNADLSEPPLQKKALQLMVEDPQIRQAYPKGNPPEIKQGDAFSPQYDSRRRTTFIEAMKESFGKVFEGELLTLVPLEAKDDRKKKIVIEVSSSIRRVPDYFIYTTGGDSPATKRVAGLLFNFEVDWDFELFSGTGRSLYKAPKTLSQPSDAKFDSGDDAPDWAPYSIMMDSAYFNYSREVTGRFGLIPPPKKDYFIFQK